VYRVRNIRERKPRIGACKHRNKQDRQCKRWFKYDRDKLWLVYTQIVPVIFEPPCKYTVTWRRVHEIIVVLEKQKVLFISVLWVCLCTGAEVCARLCSLTYPVCIALPYCHLRPLFLHHMFRHYLINAGVSLNKVTEQWLFWFLKVTWLITPPEDGTELLKHVAILWLYFCSNNAFSW
jgi:hypothetical protein